MLLKDLLTSKNICGLTLFLHSIAICTDSTVNAPFLLELAESKFQLNLLEDTVSNV